MYKINDLLIYKKDVCKVKEIKEKYLRDTDYYVLVPLKDESLTIQVPVNNNAIRNIISKEETEKIIKNIPNIDIIKSDAKILENEYKTLMQNGTHEDLIKIIKTTYLRNEERLANNKKTADKDNRYFEEAESYLYHEFSISLNLPYDSVKQYIIDTLYKWFINIIYMLNSYIKNIR